MRSWTVAGHFGELLQGRLGPAGPLALVTLPTRAFAVTARFHPAGPFRLRAPAPAPLSPADAGRLHRRLTGRPPRGTLALVASMPPGGGAGASTAALLATATAFAGGRRPPVTALARLCLEIEGASDPLMYPDPGALLWAPRAGRALATLPTLPALHVAGGFLGPGQRTDPQDLAFADIADLAAAWPAAAARRDLAALAALASESARRNARHRGGADLAPFLAAAGRHGALGVVAAHTGSAIGLLFAEAPPEAALADLSALGLAGVVGFRAGGQR